MTIFGFNTDVKLADVVYHVQSEARQQDLLLQTLIFTTAWQKKRWVHIKV